MSKLSRQGDGGEMKLLEVTLKILPAIMIRYKEEGYSDLDAIGEAISLAKECIARTEVTNDQSK